MNTFPLIIKPFGRSAVLVEWPKEVNEAILKDILAFQDVLKSQLSLDWSFVPSYNSLTLINEKETVDFAHLKTNLLAWYAAPKSDNLVKQIIWTLPVCYDAKFGLDLKETADSLGMSPSALVKQHAAQQYTVYGIGFLPGFMYLGGLPDNLETRRKDTPRLHVPKGAVGLAGKQTGIYPQDSPGGWNIIGRCPVPLFNVASKTPCFVNVGDKIQFEAIDKATFDLKRIEAEVGIYEPKKTMLNA